MAVAVAVPEVGGGVASEEDEAPEGIDVGVDPASPGAQSLVEGLNDLELPVHAVPFLIVVLPGRGGRREEDDSGAARRIGGGGEIFLGREGGGGSAHPLEVFSCVHQWPVLKTMTSASLYLAEDFSMMSSRRVSFFFPAESGVSHSWTRKGERKNSTEQL